MPRKMVFIDCETVGTESGGHWTVCSGGLVYRAKLPSAERMVQDNQKTLRSGWQAAELSFSICSLVQAEVRPEGASGVSSETNVEKSIRYWMKCFEWSQRAIQWPKTIWPSAASSATCEDYFMTNISILSAELLTGWPPISKSSLVQNPLVETQVL